MESLSLLNNVLDLKELCNKQLKSISLLDVTLLVAFAAGPHKWWEWPYLFSRTAAVYLPSSLRNVRPKAGRVLSLAATAKLWMNHPSLLFYGKGICSLAAQRTGLTDESHTSSKHKDAVESTDVNVFISFFPARETKWFFSPSNTNPGSTKERAPPLCTWACVARTPFPHRLVDFFLKREIPRETSSPVSCASQTAGSLNTKGRQDGWQREPVFPSARPGDQTKQSSYSLLVTRRTTELCRTWKPCTQLLEIFFFLIF